MAMRRGPPLAVGSAAWIAEERSAATSMADAEIEEFSFAARNEMDWLNEHMAEIFSENQMSVVELFKTPGKLRGKTPRTARKAPQGEVRVPLSDVFSSTPKGAQNPFAMALEQARTPKIRVAEDRPERPVSRPTSPVKTISAPTKPDAPAPAPAPIPFADSGYHGSQTQDTVDMDMLDRDVDLVMQQSPQRAVDAVDATDFAMLSAPRPLPEQPSPTEETFQSAREEPTRTAYVTAKVASAASPTYTHISSPVLVRAPSPSPVTSPRSPSPKKMASPNKSSPIKSSPLKQVQHTHEQKGFPQPADLTAAIDVHEDEDIRSPSDGPSPPPRQLVRKSSLNLPRLPAREPLTNNRMSRGQLDHTRTSFFNRHTGGKSLGGVIRQDFVDDDEDDDDDEMDIDETVDRGEDTTTKIAAPTKTYTQRLQDQISMLGKAQPPVPRPSSKSIANLLPTQPITTSAASQPLQTPTEPETRNLFSPKPKQSVPAPGAFPEDDDDDWIDPPAKAPVAASPRPALPKSHSAEAVPGGPRKETANDEFVRPKSRPGSPGKAPLIPERTTSAPSHTKSASVPYFPTMDLSENGDDLALKKTISVSNPTLPSVSEDGSSVSPSKSSRSFRGSPLKNVKDKLSRILTSSKGLLASSAAISAEGKASLLSSSTVRLGMHPNASVDTFRTAENVLYPDLTYHGESPSRPISPTRTNSSRRTRASAEREKKEAKEKEKEVKQREKELKEIKKQTEKLEKLRDKEAEKARVFSKEQERIAVMEKQVAAQREQEKAAQASQSQVQLQEFKTPAPPKKSAPTSPIKATRTSPRKTKADADNLSSENDVDMADATTSMPPPSVPRSALASASRPQTIKKSIKPSREPLVKSRQPPATVIRVNTTSSQHSQFHSTSALSANLQETLGQQQAPPRQLTSKPSHTMLHSKSSMASLAGSVSSSGPGRPKALGIAAKRKEQEEREAQQKREAKQEVERKRAAIEAERKQEEQRKAEAEKQQREEDRKARKAALEKAKQTKAPPAAVRSQPNGPPEYAADKAPPRPVSRLANTMQQKAPSKRLLQDAEDKPQPPRTMASYHQPKDPKRMRMSEEFDQDIDMADTQPNIKGPPIRPSAGLKKDLAKSMFPNGYSNAPSQSSSQNLLRAAVTTAQHNGQVKAANPLDMAQVSKGPIVFAPNPNAPGQAHKTPARTALTSKQQPKSAKSSPRFPNGDAIELPEINTDDEDSDEDDSHIAIAPWADSPALKPALMAQEMMDPMQIFGPPRPINMEEVFSKSKDRFHKFRARTSSANWSGSDRLTEEDIRKDLRAREKLRKEGGWSYELSREMA